MFNHMHIMVILLRMASQSKDFKKAYSQFPELTVIWNRYALFVSYLSAVIHIIKKCKENVYNAIKLVYLLLWLAKPSSAM